MPKVQSGLIHTVTAEVTALVLGNTRHICLTLGFIKHVPPNLFRYEDDGLASLSRPWQLSWEGGRVGTPGFLLREARPLPHPPPCVAVAPFWVGGLPGCGSQQAFPVMSVWAERCVRGEQSACPAGKCAQCLSVNEAPQELPSRLRMTGGI